MELQGIFSTAFVYLIADFILTLNECFWCSMCYVYKINLHIPNKQRNTTSKNSKNSENSPKKVTSICSIYTYVCTEYERETQYLWRFLPCSTRTLLVWPSDWMMKWVSLVRCWFFHTFFFSVLSFLFILPSAFLHALFINNKLREPLNVYQTTFRDVVLRNVNKSAEEFNL